MNACAFPGCDSGMIHFQHPAKPAGVILSSLPCPLCVAIRERDEARAALARAEVLLAEVAALRKLVEYTRHDGACPRAVSMSPTMEGPCDYDGCEQPPAWLSMSSGAVFCDAHGACTCGLDAAKREASGTP